MFVCSCPICKSDDCHVIHTGLRERIKIDGYVPGKMKEIDVYKCDVCGHVWLNEFIDDPDTFFEESGMRDFSPVSINQIRRDMYSEHLRYLKDVESIIRDKTLCDFGCGSGGFIKLAEPVAKKVVGIEMEKAMRDALTIENGSDFCYKSIDSIGNVDVITLFHVLDHLQSPYEYLEKMKAHLTTNGQIYIETPNAEDALVSIYHCDSFSNFTYYVCHFMYYTAQSIKILAEKAGFNVEFIRYKQRYPLANHLYWLRNGMPGGHEKWSFLREDTLDKAYESMLSKLGATDTITALLSVK